MRLPGAGGSKGNRGRGPPLKNLAPCGCGPDEIRDKVYFHLHLLMNLSPDIGTENMLCTSCHFACFRHFC